MKTPENVFESTTTNMQGLFVDVAAEFGIDGELTMVSHSPMSSVAIDDDAGGREAHVALRLALATDPEAMLEDTRKRVGVLQDLRGNGAQVIEYLDEPRLVRDAQHMGSYILTISRYLPVKGATPFEHGQAIASLHNASLRVDTAACEEINILEQLASAGRTVEHLNGIRKRGASFQLGDVKMSPDQIEAYAHYIDASEKLRRELFVTSQQKGLPEVVVQEDVHSGNVMRDSQGVPIAIDVEGYIGPSAIDLGRPLTDWHPRFGTPLQDVCDYIAGYDAHIDPRVKPDEKLRQMASDYINMRSSLVFISMAVTRAIDYQASEEWLLRQGLHRLQVIEDRNAPWVALDSAYKTQDD